MAEVIESTQELTTEEKSALELLNQVYHHLLEPTQALSKLKEMIKETEVEFPT